MTDRLTDQSTNRRSWSREVRYTSIKSRTDGPRTNIQIVSQTCLSKMSKINYNLHRVATHASKKKFSSLTPKILLSKNARTSNFATVAVTVPSKKKYFIMNKGVTKSF